VPIRLAEDKIKNNPKNNLQVVEFLMNSQLPKTKEKKIRYKIPPKYLSSAGKKIFNKIKKKLMIRYFGHLMI